jgi:hypothetical protein
MARSEQAKLTARPQDEKGMNCPPPPFKLACAATSLAMAGVKCEPDGRPRKALTSAAAEAHQNESPLSLSLSLSLSLAGVTFAAGSASLRAALCPFYVSA